MSEQLDRLKPALAHRYRIDRELGRGGMATVYLAEDLKNDRQVAIKVLRPEIAASLGRDRFLREVAITAKLDHPHILPLYDSGEADGVLFYVMPYVEGESLRQRLNREKQLSVEEATRFAREVADALDFAHARGIVHRDVKPENIMLAAGHARVADFGIARAIQSAGGEALTETGLALGTPKYMSPEQATGSTTEIDGRSDVYALGCVLYEMLTGDVPFTGENFQAVLAQVVTGEVPPVSRRRLDVPPEVDQSVARALAKSPQDRHQSASDFAASLEPGAPRHDTRPWWRRYAVHAAAAVLLLLLVGTWWLGPRPLASAVASDAQVIAVLPFSTSGPEVELLSEGMVDLLTTNLDGVGGIRTVDPRTVLHRWHRRASDGSLDLDGSLALGRDVDAGSILLGSVVAAGAQVRLSATLQAVHGAELARVSAEGHSDSVISLVDTLSVRLMREIWRTNAPLPQFRVSGVTTGSLPAIRSFLEGMQYYRRSQWDSAAAAFERAVAEDSTFALAWLNLSTVRGWISGHGTPEATEGVRQAAAFAERLPPREREQVRIAELFGTGDLAVVDSVVAYVRRYPDDADGWLMLGETRFHAQPLLALPPESILAPFDTVLRLDPNLTPAAIHPLDLTLLFQDSARFFHYLEIVAEAPPSPSLDLYRFASGVAFGGEVLTADTVAKVLQEGPGAMGPLYAMAFASGSSIDPVIGGAALYMARLPEGSQARVGWMLNRISLLISVGRIREAGAIVDTLWQLDPAVAAQVALATAIAGVPEWPYVDRALATRRELVTRDPQLAPNAVLAETWYALSQGDGAAARRHVARVDTTQLAGTSRGAFHAALGWLRAIDGDTTTGIEVMRGAIRRAGFTPSASGQLALTRYHFARLLATRPATRREAARRLEYDWWLRGATPFAMLDAGRVYELLGEREQAARSYSHFLDAMREADPSMDAHVEEARQGLLRVMPPQ